MRWLLKGKFKLFRGQTGFTLIEVTFAVGILAVIGVVFIGSLNTAYRSVGVLDEQTQAEALARSQMEDIKDSTYNDSGNYTVTVDLPPQYSISIDVEVPTIVSANTTTLQEITVSVSRPTGEGDRPIFSVSTYKVKE
jgi:prepilin-type N-terminal cleavage/methylation domain-containing protein